MSFYNFGLNIEIFQTLETIPKSFFKKNLEDISPFCGATDTPVFYFWWPLLLVSKPEWAALFALDRIICVTCSRRFNFGATPANLLAASMAAESISSIYLWAGIGGAPNQDLWCHRQKLHWLSYAGSAPIPKSSPKSEQTRYNWLFVSQYSLKSSW